MPLHFIRCSPLCGIAFLLLLNATCFPVECRGNETGSEKDVLSIRRHVAGQEVRVVIRVERIDVRPLVASHRVIWGFSGANYEPAIKSISFTDRHGEIRFPKAMFADMLDPYLDPSLVSVSFRDHCFHLSFLGSDGEGGYTTDYKIKAGSVVERRISWHIPSEGHVTAYYTR